MEGSIIAITSFVTVINNALIYIASTTFGFDIRKYIPMVSVILGLIMGVIGYYSSNIEMGSNLMEAVFIGVSAGSAATGINQIGKQMTKDQ